MAKIIDNYSKRRSIKLNIEDIIDIVREYQNITCDCKTYDEIRTRLSSHNFLLPEDID